MFKIFKKLLKIDYPTGYFLVFTFQRKNNEEEKRGSASARSNNCSCLREISWKKDIQLASLPQPFDKNYLV